MDLDLLQRAEKLADLGNAKNRLLMQAKRDKDAGKLSDEGNRRHEDLGKDRASRLNNLQFLRDWAAGRLNAGPQRSDVAAETQGLRDRDSDHWLNYNELLKATGGHVSEVQKRYADKLWRNAQGKGEKEHPDGSSLPKRRRFNMAQVEERWRQREARNEVRCKREDFTADDAEGFLERFASTAAEEPGPAEEQLEPKTKKGDLTRAELLMRFYKLVPLLHAVQDKLPPGAWGDMARARLQPALDAAKRQKTRLEDAPHMQDDELQVAKAVLKNGQETAMALSKMASQLSLLEAGA